VSFFLHDINFLNFTRHLSEHLVAAFAKRLARLTLVAPPQDIHIILMFIGNLVLRHPGLKRLFNHPTGGEGKSLWQLLDVVLYRANSTITS